MPQGPSLCTNPVAKTGTCLNEGTDVVMLMRPEDSSKLLLMNISLYSEKITFV